MLRTLTIFLVGLHFLANAQPQIEYGGLCSKGKLPKNFGHTFYEEYLLNKRNINIDMPRKERLIEDQFHIESNYSLYNLQFSGKIIYGSALNDYVNKVADSLLANKPELRSRIKVFIVRSSSLNAFATNQGYIYINIGLLSRLNNEAQLAYVLAHEIVHYLNEHVINGYVYSKSKKLEGFRNSIEKEEEYLLKIHNYSHGLEFEADSIGFNLLSESKYDLSSALNTFDLLKNADHPIFELENFNSFFNIDRISPVVFINAIPNEKDSLNNEEEDIIEHLSTHPKVEERTKRISSMIELKNISHHNKFLISQEEFNKVSHIAKMEHLMILLEEGLYDRALYCALAAQTMYPNNNYIKEIGAKALFSLSYAIAMGKDGYIDDEKDGSRLKLFSSYLRHLKSDQLNSFALMYGAKVLQQTNSEELKSKAVDYMLFYQSFFDYLKDYNIKEDDKEEVKYCKAAISELVSLKEYEQLLVALEKSKNAAVARRMGNLIVYKSTNIVIDIKRPGPPVNYLLGELTSEAIDHYIDESKEIEGQKLQIISPYLMDENSVEEYNDMVAINQIISEALSNKRPSVIESKTREQLIKKYNSNVLFVPITVTLIEKGPGAAGIITSFYLVPFYTPFMVRDAIKGNRKSYFNGILINLNTNKVLTNEVYWFKKKSPEETAKLGIIKFLGDK